MRPKRESAEARGEGPIPAAARNEVWLVGRLSGEPNTRVLPSGDELTIWRLVVDRESRPKPRTDGSRSASVDTIDCSTQRRAVQRSAARWRPGDVVEVRGALRRRFWRGATGPVSRYEVDVSEARRVDVAVAG